MRTFKAMQQEQDAANLSELPLDTPVAVYYRQSGAAQVGNISTAMQQIDLVADMKRRGWSDENIILIDADAGVSGTLKIDERAGMRRLFSLITDKAIGAVACQDEDRLFRDVTQIQVNIFIDACLHSRVQVITPSITYIFHHPQQGEFYKRAFRQKSEMAAEYLNYIKHRLGGARNRVLRDGRYAGARLTRGYMADFRDKNSSTYRQIVPFEPVAEIVREVFRTFVETDGSAQRTQQLLRARGVAFPTPAECQPPDGYRINYSYGYGGTPPRLHKRTILLLVTNPVYIGHWMHKGVIVRWNNHEPLVTEDLFYTAFNLASKYALDGSKNAQYTGKNTKARPKDVKRPDNIELPLLEGKLWLHYEGERRRVGVRYNHRARAYDYAVSDRAGLAGTPVWKRRAQHLDHAVTHYLRARLTVTGATKTLKNWIKQENVARGADLRRIDGQIKNAARVMESLLDTIPQLSAEAKASGMLEELERRYIAAKQEQERLTAMRERVRMLSVVADRRNSILGMVNRWLQEGIPRADYALLLAALVERIEIPDYKPHAKIKIVIYWHDGEVTPFHLQHAEARGWDIAEFEALDYCLSKGAPQVVLSAALPNREWTTIRQQIFHKHAGKAVPHDRRVKQKETFKQYVKRAHGLQIPQEVNSDHIIWLKDSNEWYILITDIPTDEMYTLWGTGELEKLSLATPRLDTSAWSG